MAHSFDELKAKTVAELREIAKGAVQGAPQMNKEHLLPVLRQTLGIDTHTHHEVRGIDKAAIKAQVRALKTERDRALDVHDHLRLRAIRRQMHHLNHQIAGRTFTATSRPSRTSRAR